MANNYPVSQLTTIQDCDALLGIADKEKKDLEWRKHSLERQKSQYANAAMVNASELSSRRAELAALDIVIAGLPAGEFKNEQEIKRTEVWYRVFRLENKQASFGDVAVLEKEFEIKRVQKELDETATLISEVTDHKATLA